MYNIFKILFAAEKYHLNEHCRPITGDKYVAMEHGTVPVWLYENIKANNLRGVVISNHHLYAERHPITKIMSDSDIKALEHGYNEYAGLSFSAVKEKNHKEASWIKNWKKRGVNKSVDIPFEDLIEEDWIKDDLETTSGILVL